MGKSPVCDIIRGPCDGLWAALQPTYMKAPETIQDWVQVANKFEEQWKFPNCIGTIDGKHVHMDVQEKLVLHFSTTKIFIALFSWQCVMQSIVLNSLMLVVMAVTMMLQSLTNLSLAKCLKMER